MNKRGKGAHAADELYLAAHVILEGNEPKETANEAASNAGLARLEELPESVTGMREV
jgi:hypothetical protein